MPQKAHTAFVKAMDIYLLEDSIYFFKAARVH